MQTGSEATIPVRSQAGTAVSEIAEFVNKNDISHCRNADEIFEYLSQTIELSNDKIYRMGIEIVENRGMATTLVMAYIRNMTSYVANIGDSRAYLFRDGVLRKITVDHTYVNELVQQGVITEDEAENHKQKNVITKALGAEAYIDPDFYKIDIHKNDIIMLCSDGLYGEVSEEEIVNSMNRDINMNDLCCELVDKALEAGGRDNITVVCLKI